MSTLAPTAEQREEFATGDDGTPVTMLNLLRYRARADYGEHQNETPCSGAEAYGRYAQHAIECIEHAGGRVVLTGAAAALLIGPPAERWDDMLLVEYPSRRALLDMLASERYLAIVHHRTAALADSRLIPLAIGKAHFQA